MMPIFPIDLRKSKLERIYRIYKTTKNWHEVLLAYLGLKKFCVALLRSGYRIPVSKNSWSEFWKCITIEFLKSKLENIHFIDEDAVAFKYNKREIILKLPKQINFAPLLYTFFYEDYKYLNVSGKCVIDVGAYIGDTAIYFALKGARKVFAIEPYPYTYNLLVENIRMNSLDSVVKPINAAIMDSDGIMLLPYIEEDTAGKLAYNSEKGVEIPCYKLSTLVDMLKHSEEVYDGLVLKLDCEGCEYYAILGSSSETLREFEEIILEFHGNPKPLMHKLRECGFKVNLYSIDLKSKTGMLFAKRKIL